MLLILVSVLIYTIRNSRQKETQDTEPDFIIVADSDTHTFNNLVEDTAKPQSLTMTKAHSDL